MTKKYEVYKCEVCGNIVEVLHEGDGDLVCCNQPMQLMKEQEAEQGTEKHKPVIEKKETGILIKVGSIPHPMDEKHYIEWIEVIRKDGKSCKVMLRPGEKPEAEFPADINDVKEVRSYCNIHGLWSTKL
jgi:superoxide reductase